MCQIRTFFVSDCLMTIFALNYSSNININDVLGNYSLTLIDALDTLLVCHSGVVLLSSPGRSVCSVYLGMDA